MLDNIQELFKRIGVLPELALRTVQGQVPGQTNNPREFMQSALDIVNRRPGALGSIGPFTDPGSAFGRTKRFREQGGFEGNRDAEFPVSFALGGVQAVGGSGAIGAAQAAKSPVTVDIPSVDSFAAVRKFQIRTKPQVDALAKQVSSGKITMDDLIARTTAGKLNMDVMQRVSEKVQGLELLTQFNQLVGAGNKVEATKIFAKVLQLPASHPMKDWLINMGKMLNI